MRNRPTLLGAVLFLLGCTFGPSLAQTPQCPDPSLIAQPQPQMIFACMSVASNAQYPVEARVKALVSASFLRGIWRDSAGSWINLSIADLTNAIALRPEPTSSYSEANLLSHRANMHALVGNSHQVLNDLSRAIALEPSSHILLLARASFLRKSGRIEEAIRDLEAVIRTPITVPNFSGKPYDQDAREQLEELRGGSRAPVPGAPSPGPSTSLACQKFPNLC